MTHEIINPDTVYASLELGYSQAIKTDRAVTIHCSGQVAWDKDQNVVGEGDVGAQAAQALANLKAVLAAAGASINDIVQMRTYVVNHNPALLGPIGQAFGEFYGDVMPAANTWIGVQALALPEFLIEIEAIAKID